MKCPSCQSDIQEGWKACPACGNKLPEVVKCLSCGKELKAGWKVCPFCGAGTQESSSTATTIKDSVVKELHQDHYTDVRTAGGATVGGGININISDALCSNGGPNPDVEYEQQVIVFLKAEGHLENAKSHLEEARKRLGISLHVTNSIEKACFEKMRSESFGSDEKIRTRWDELRGPLRAWADDREKPFPEGSDVVLTIRGFAQKGDPEAQYFLGICYYFGKDIRKDFKETVKWFKRAADQGMQNAERDLGCCYRDGTGVAVDQMEAVKWFHRAAERGDTKTMFLLAVAHYLGRGVAKNYVEAARLFRKCVDAKIRIEQAFVNLGLMYWYGGNGIEQDYIIACEWFKKAAVQGNTTAMYFLGDAYQEGIGIDKNIKKAKEWYQKGADSGAENCKEALAEISGFKGWLNRNFK